MKNRQLHFSILMSVLMCLSMKYYRSILMGYSVSLTLLGEAIRTGWWVSIIVYLVQTYIGLPLANRLFLLFPEKLQDSQHFRATLRRLSMVTVMCPSMTLISLLLFHPQGFEGLRYLQTLVQNFPMALFLQVCIYGPLLTRFVLNGGKKNED